MRQQKRYQGWLSSMINYSGFLVLLTALLSSVVCLDVDAGEPDQRVDESVVSDQVRSSVGRLKSFGDESILKQYAPDPEREKDIQRLLPNYQVTQKGTSDRRIRDQAIKRLNKIQLTNSGRQMANNVVDKLSLFRRMPEVCFEVNPETYEYFVGHPDIVVSLWQAMGISGMKLRQTGKFKYELDNNDGTVCDLYYLRKSKTTNVIYCQGKFKSPLLKNPIQARGVLCLHSKFEKHKDGTIFVRHHADVFLRFPSPAVETAARLISPVSNYIADRNFQEISLFMHSISLTMARQPSWVQQIASQLPGVHPNRSRELQEIVRKNYQANQKRLATRWDEFQSPAL